MLSKVKNGILFLAFFLGVTSFAVGQESAPENVVVVANRSVPGSLEVAEAYMSRRQIPEKNLLVIEASVNEGISREHFNETIYNPLLRQLIDKDLVDVFEGSADVFGRSTVTIFENPIRYMVLCYGVPLRISEIQRDLLDDLSLRRGLLTGPNQGLVQAFSEDTLGRNRASVDGELALLLKRDMPMNGFVPNPFFKNFTPGSFTDVIKVTRLDGPSPEAVIRMIDNAIKAEKEGLKGRAYVDEDGRGGPYAAGNTWLSGTADLFRKLGFDLQHETSKQTFQPDARFDAPVLYAGWYTSKVDGPFTLPGFRFPPGAIAAHLHSFSASTLRTDNKGWVGPMVARGVTATFGNVAEPYLTFTHHFNLFFAALAEGWNFADAAYFALPALSWQAIAVGDPLYRPFAVDLEDQLADIGDPLKILEDQYVLLRKVNLIEKENPADALKEAEKGMREAPGIALGLKRARLLESVGRKKEARKSLVFLADLKPTSSMEWGLFAELADTLHNLGDAKAALKIYKGLSNLKMPEQVQLAFLKRGIKVAQDAGETRLAIDWQARVTPPPPVVPEAQVPEVKQTPNP